MRRASALRWLIPGLVMGGVMVATTINTALALPVFARKYKTSCVTCHYAFPKLNGFGKAFRNNGYRYPGNDADMVKEEPVSMGNENYKKVWPDAVWPSDIPGGVPLAIHAVGLVAWDVNPPNGVSSNSMEFPKEVGFHFAGTLGDDFSVIGEVEIANEDGETEIGFPFRLEWNLDPLANIVVGAMHTDPSPDARRLTESNYNIVNLESRNGLSLEGEKSGLALWGAANGASGKGGLYYMAGVVNGQGVNDNNSDKDVFARAEYKIGGLGQLGGTAGQGSATSASYEDDHLSVGAFGYLGKAGDEGGALEDVTMYAGTLEWWYKRFILNGGALGMKSSIDGMEDRTSLAWYAQGQYVLYPWLFGLARVESTDEDTGDAIDANLTLIPGVVALVRANVKATLEYSRPLNEYDSRKEEEGLFLKTEFAF